MIEKLKIIEDDEIDMSIGAVNTRFEDTELVRKINELVDAVNELQKDYDNVCIWVGEQNLLKDPQVASDSYAEQRKWIGKLCRVETGGEYRYGILKDVSASHPTHPFNMGGLFFRVCEPVKPDDDIIYKKCE